jgi:hypothetical protein
MSLTSSAGAPQPNLAWQFESSNVDSVAGVAPTTSVGPPTYNPSGKYGSSIVFNNTPGASPGTYYLKYTTGISLSTASGFTVCAWVKPLSVGVSGNQTFLCIAGQNTYFILQIDTGGTVIHLYGQNPYTVPNNINGGNFAVTQSVWIHAVMVFSGTSITTYFNGTLKDSLSLVVSPVTFSAFSLGNRSAINADSSANCEVDDVRIFNTALSATQVQAIYNAQGMPSRGVQSSFYANITAPTIYSFSSQTFSNAQATSNIGPTQSQLNTVYPSLAPTYLTSNAGIQTWTAPITGVYSLVAAGAAGGTASTIPSGGGAAGSGVVVGCQAIFQKNQIVSFIVGQLGNVQPLQTTSNIGGGGGGGSFIVDYKTGLLYIAAGGGGGASCPPTGQTSSSAGFDASYTPNGVNGGPGATDAAGGVNGNGGYIYPFGGAFGNCGGPGGGYYTGGFSGGNQQSNSALGGNSVLQGAAGGYQSNTATNLSLSAFGGFGCGGSGGNISGSVISSAGAGGGGGGGYSGGGAGGRVTRGGGGGGSYAPPGQILQQLGLCTSNGYVSISYLYPVSIQMWHS